MSITRISIEEFKDEYKFLSNYYVHPIVWGDKVYPSSEHLYQCGKFLPNSKERNEILSLKAPQTTKNRARKLVKAGKNLTPNWEDGVKLTVMNHVIRMKFAPGSEMAELLLLTGNSYLKEGNWWGDNYWGDCNPKYGCDGHKGTKDCTKIQGQNWLGRILTAIRNELQAKQ